MGYEVLALVSQAVLRRESGCMEEAGMFGCVVRRISVCSVEEMVWKGWTVGAGARDHEERGCGEELGCVLDGGRIVGGRWVESVLMPFNFV